MKKTGITVLFVCICLSMVLIISCGKDSKPVIQVKGLKITISDIKDMLKDTPDNYRSFLMSEVGRKQFLDMLAKEKLVLQAARQAGVQNKKEVKEAVVKFKNEYKKRMRDYENNIIVTTYLKELQEKKFIPTESEMEQYYKVHKKQFLSPQEIKVSHILLATFQDAENTIRRLKSGENFANLARELSIDPNSGQYGGDLGTIKKQEMFPEFEAELDRLSVGEYSQVPVQTNYGFHILKKTGQKQLPSVSFENAKPDIRQLMLKEKFDEWIATKRIEMGMKIDYDALKSLMDITK